MSDTQQQPPPPGPPPFPDFAALPHDNYKANLYASSVICWAIAAIFVAMRFYTRGIIIRVLGPSDWCILLALVRVDRLTDCQFPINQPAKVFSTGDLVALIDRPSTPLPCW